MDLSTKKRLAASVLKVGKNRVKLDPEASEEILDAITRESIKELFVKGIIQVKRKQGISRGRVKLIKENLKKRGRGPGSKEGAKGARRGKKSIWVTKVRALRSRIKVMRDRGEITGIIFDDLYRQIKGGQIRSIRHMMTIIKQYKR